MKELQRNSYFKKYIRQDFKISLSERVEEVDEVVVASKVQEALRQRAEALRQRPSTSREGKSAEHATT